MQLFRFAVCSLVAFFITAPVFAEETKPEIITVWPVEAPGEKGDIPEEAPQAPRPNDTTIRIANVTKPTLEIYRPAADKNTGTAVVICPGGAYGILAYNKEGTEVAQWLQSIGVTGIVLKYRVPARKGRVRHDAPLEDAQRALGIVRSRASERGVDPER